MKTILVIDPSESHRLLLEEELRKEGYRVITAPDPRGVLSAKQRFKPDLLILDFRQQNPQAETLGAVRDLYPRIPWVGYSVPDSCPEEFRKWVSFYLPKSSGMGELKRLIKSLGSTS